MLPELKRLIEQMGKDRGLDKEIIIEALEAAILSAARKKLGNQVDIEAHYNEETGEIEVFQFKVVVETVTDSETQVALSYVRENLDPEAESGDSIGSKIDATTFGRIAVQAAKQIIIQRVKDAERDNVYEGYKDRKGEIVNGFVQRFEGGSIIVNLGRTEGVIPTSEQIHREIYKRGDRIRAYLLDVKRITKGPQIILSRTHPHFLRALFEVEVPEISEGLIEIINVAREAGKRSKISVSTHDKDIDPVGACVGMRGSRVQSVVQELRGEKIDIVPFSDDTIQYVCSALSPAKVSHVVVDEENHSIAVIVPDDQLSLAIGKNGQNVRLAVKLTGWKLDVKSEAMDANKEETGFSDLLRISTVDEELANRLFNAGFKSIASIAAMDAKTLSSMADLDEQRAEILLHEATNLLDEVLESGQERRTVIQ